MYQIPIRTNVLLIRKSFYFSMSQNGPMGVRLQRFYQSLTKTIATKLSEQGHYYENLHFKHNVPYRTKIRPIKLAKFFPTKILLDEYLSKRLKQHYSFCYAHYFSTHKLLATIATSVTFSCHLRSRNVFKTQV